MRGITPTFTLTLPQTVDLTETNNVYATFRQGTNELTKTGDDLTVSEHEVDVYLTQSETLSFNRGTVLIQLNWTYADGSRGCSEVVGQAWGENLLERVLE